MELMNKNIECFEHRGLLAFVCSLPPHFSASLSCAIDTVYTAPEHHKFIYFSSSSIPRQALKPHVLSLSNSHQKTHQTLANFEP